MGKDFTHVDEMKNFILLAESAPISAPKKEVIPIDNLLETIFGENEPKETPPINESILVKKLQDLIFKYENHYQALDESKRYYGDGYNDAMSRIALDLKMLLTKVGVV